MSKDPFLQAIDQRGVRIDSALRAFHSGPREKRYEGRCTITRGRGLLVRLALWLGRFPPEGEDQVIRLAMHIGEQETRWLRGFGGHPTASTLKFDEGRAEVIERFGALRVAMRPEAQGGDLHLAITRLWVLGIPVPRVLIPRSATRERGGENGRVYFDVSGNLPVFGLLIRYTGWLDPVTTQT